MDNKEPLRFISALRWAFSIILILLLFFLPFNFIYYSDISLDSKISSFFSFISSLGILATISVYLWQKYDNKIIEKNINCKIISHTKTQLSYICYDFYQKISQIQSLSDFINEEYGTKKYQCNSSIYNINIRIIANKYILKFNLKKEEDWGYSEEDIYMIKKEQPLKYKSYIFIDFENNINQILKLNSTIATIDIELSENINLALSEMRTSSTFLDNIIYHAASNNFEYLNQACDSFLCNGNDNATQKREINNKPQHGFESIYNLITKENLH
ncbi:hypothetical protein [Proteus terrae]|uniref:hypothetical protein n=1 Tax=Proteus terrae TaxID=1574161 RepID=UPI00298CFFFB|nr:hypothetical protein [Proteus terrae]WPD00338.1 hypothetical protein R5P25_07460 [Proteus terrae]